MKPATAGSFFTVLRRILPRNGIVVTDSGLHQGLVRRHFDVLSPRGLIIPNDFQSMGFGLPAAIGAKLAAPERPVVAVLGDGGFAMSGMEMLTAVREKIPLTVIVFNDGRLNLIRLQQFQSFGSSESVDILNPDFGTFAAAVGARYALVDGNIEQVLRTASGQRSSDARRGSRRRLARDSSHEREGVHPRNSEEGSRPRHGAKDQTLARKELAVKQRPDGNSK